MQYSCIFLLQHLKDRSLWHSVQAVRGSLEAEIAESGRKSKTNTHGSDVSDLSCWRRSCDPVVWAVSCVFYWMFITRHYPEALHVPISFGNTQRTLLNYYEPNGFNSRYLVFMHNQIVTDTESWSYIDELSDALTAWLCALVKSRNLSICCKNELICRQSLHVKDHQTTYCVAARSDVATVAARCWLAEIWMCFLFVWLPF